MPQIPLSNMLMTREIFLSLIEFNHTKYPPKFPVADSMEIIYLNPRFFSQDLLGEGLIEDREAFLQKLSLSASMRYAQYYQQQLYLLYIAFAN